MDYCLSYEYIKLFDKYENLRIRNDLCINELKYICKENDEIISFMKKYIYYRFLEVNKESNHITRLDNLHKNYIIFEEIDFNKQKMSMKNELINNIKILVRQLKILSSEIIKMNNEFNYLNELCNNVLL